VLVRNAIHRVSCARRAIHWLAGPGQPATEGAGLKSRGWVVVPAAPVHGVGPGPWSPQAWV